MKIYKLYTLRTREIREIYAEIGGKYNFRERFSRKGTGSPLLYYLDGHPQIDELNERVSDELRINFEEFKAGFMVGISERTHPYILPLKPGEIKRIRITLTREKVQPRKSSFFSWLLKIGVKVPQAQLFACPDEHTEAKTDLVIETSEYPIHCWTTAAEFIRVKKFFEKSNFQHVLEINQ